MSGRETEWRGYWPAAPTPFKTDGVLDEAAFRDVLTLYRDQRVHGVLVNGTTGEWFSQSPYERRRVAEIAVDTLSGSQVPVVVGCSSFTPKETISLAEHARSIGADGALTTVPPYVHPSDEESAVFFHTVTEAVDLPWMVYNWPRGTGIDLSVELLSGLADLDGVAAIKESSADEIKALECCEAVMDRVRFFGRFIHPRGMAFLIGLGGDGNIDGGGVGAVFGVPFYEAVWSGDLATAKHWSQRYARLTAQLVDSGYGARFASPTAQVKAAMNLLGQPGGSVRPPLLDLDDATRLNALRDALEMGGLQPAEAAR